MAFIRDFYQCRQNRGDSFSFVGWAVVAAIVTETGFLFLSGKALAQTRWIKPSLFIILFFTVVRWLGCAFVETPLLFVALHAIARYCVWFLSRMGYFMFW